MVMYAPRCPDCGLPCVCSHSHKHSCGCLKGHVWDTMLCKNCGHQIYEEEEKGTGSESSVFFYGHVNPSGIKHKDFCDCENPEVSGKEILKIGGLRI